MKKGMSLFYMVVVIAVMIILAGTTLVGMQSGADTISAANENVFKLDARQLAEELESNIALSEITGEFVDEETVNAESLEDIKKYIPSFPNKYDGVYKIKNGKLVFCGEGQEAKDWIEDLAYIEIEE